MNTNSPVSFHHLSFELGDTPPDVRALAAAAEHLGIDWSAVLGGTIRLGAEERLVEQQAACLHDVGGKWLLIVPTEQIAGPFEVLPGGLRGPLGHDRIALAAWLLLAALPATSLPDVLLVDAASDVASFPWPRIYHYAVGLFEPKGTYAGSGNPAFDDAVHSGAVAEAPAWLQKLRLPCAAVALGQPKGTDAGLVTWNDLALNAAQLAQTAHQLSGAFWPPSEHGACSISEIGGITPMDELADQGSNISQARRGLPPWMAESAPAGLSASQIEQAKAWAPE